jgi:hypothetical protein
MAVLAPTVQQLDRGVQQIKSEPERMHDVHKPHLAASLRVSGVFRYRSNSDEGKEQYVNQCHHQYGGKDQPPIIRLHRWIVAKNEAANERAWELEA